MIMRRTLRALAVAIMLGACATPPASGPVVISLTRTPCYGFCPVYSVSITSGGEVTYIGRQFVNVVGEQHATIPSADVERLLARFDAMGFESLRDEYRADVTDLPSTTIVLERNGQRKSVLDYGGTGAGMPEAVRELEAEIDRVAGTARWVLRNGAPVRDRPKS